MSTQVNEDHVHYSIVMGVCVTYCAKTVAKQSSTTASGTNMFSMSTKDATNAVVTRPNQCVK